MRIAPKKFIIYSLSRNAVDKENIEFHAHWWIILSTLKLANEQINTTNCITQAYLADKL